MTKKHNNRMFNVDERERFKKRKSKKYKNLCSVAVTTLAIVGVATATTVKADEVAGPEVTATEVVTTVTETETTTSVEVTPVIESPAPSTNLTEAQPEPTQEATTVQEASDTQSGEIAVTNASEQLNTAVSQAEQEGVQVKEEVAKDYGVTTSAEETAAKQAEIQADYTKQTEEITRVTESYVAEKEAHAVATEKVIVENNQLKEEYDAKIAAYNAEVKKVNAANAAIDAAYDKARQVYEAEVANITAANNQAKEQYEVALAKYKADVERINAENEEKRLAYESAKSSYNTNIAEIEAENNLIKQRNQIATDTYNKAMSVYLTEKEKYDKAISTATSNTAIDGNLSEVTAQSLIFKRESNAKATISGQQTFFSWVNGDDGLSVINASKGQHISAGHTVSDPFWADVLAPGGIVGGSGETGRVQATVFGLGRGESTTISYTNLENSSYGGRKISRVDYTYTVLSSPASDESFTMVVYKDPTITTYFGTSKDGDAMRDGKIQMDVTYYYEDGSPVIFDNGDAILSFSSLNRTELPIGEQEYVSGLTNVTPIQITGSSVVYQDGKLGALSSNNSKEHGSKFDRGEWDSTAENPNSYYGAGAAKVNSGTKTISFVIGNHPTEAGTRGTLRHWFQFNSEVRTTGGIIGTPPKEPVLKLEEFKTPTLIPPVTPDYEELPEAPTVSYKDIPEAPEKAPSVPLPIKPEEPIYKELPTAPKRPTISYHYATLQTKPHTEKTVETTEGVNVDKGLVAKGQEIVFDLKIDSLPANRSLTTSGVLTDPLPKGFILDLEKTVNAAAGYELSYSTDNHVLSGVFTKETILALNADLTKVVSLPTFKVYGWVSNDAATYKNTFTIDFNGGEGKINGYTRTSNTVVVHTPGDPNDPDNPTNNEINPTKLSTNAAGVIIDGKPVPAGGEIFYRITLDYDQYHAITPDKETIGKGFGGFDDYPEEALAVDLGRAIIIDSDGKPVTGLLLKDNASFATSDSKVQELLTQSGIKSKISGAFVSVVAEDPFAYYENIIKAKKSVTILIPMTVKEGLYNTGTKVSNTAYQLDFGNGYVTNTVTNPTPIVTPTKVNTNSQGVVINGKPVLANSVNYYKVELDYSDYKGIEADEKLIALGFYGLDDYPEEALVLETSGFQFIASDNSLVKGLTATAYADLLEAPKALQEAMAKQGFKPKGAILVFSADDPQAYYEAYVKTGMKITATLPMTVKAELAKTGGTYENTAYQSEFGSAYVTDTIVNNVPKLDPKKDIVIDLSHDTESLAGKDIEVGTIFNYLLAGAELPAGRGSDITSYTWFDDYDENRDQYDGVYKIFAPIAFKTKDGISYAARTELTRYAIQTVDTATGKTFIKLDEDFLRSIDSSSAFKADLYLQMKRVGTGDVYNSYTHGVNGAEVESNTTVSHTPVGDVTVSYKEKGGKELKQSVVDTPEGPTGRGYDTTDNRLEEIITEDGKVYKLVPELTEGKETGTVSKGNTNITYVYEEVKADVLINYTDEAGKVIKRQVKDVDQGSIGSDYDTTDNKPEFIEVDGVKYKLMPKKTIGNETGKLPREGAEVTYVYHKIVTNWVEEGTRDNLKPQEDGEKERGSFEGYEYIEKEVDEETGDITYVFKKIPQPAPAPEKPKPTPVAETPKPQPAPVVQAATLPATGEESSVGYVALGMVAMTAAAGLAVPKRRKEEN
ncbi:SspB-related isopeptide-forming adhesin [Streptococcus suis]|uniref:SspB-related isopeptide-forming adhesin n=1 Tax=Streptococcus suis TaxID=1307 RepID=UPI000400B841|nr:SspB-related isopeptide-forming adhesin [Streptococcus suis]HEM3179771.1 LPXTG cell wall anchor domain-containing protein [Streptococcus suis 92-4172]